MKKKFFIILGILAIGFGISIFSLSYVSSKSDVPYVKTKIPDITLIGPIDMLDGIGKHTTELADILLEDYKVQIMSNRVIDDNVPASVIKAIQWSFTQFGKVVFYEENLWDGDTKRLEILKTEINKEDQIRIAHGIADASRIPHEWVFNLNVYFDAVIAPNEFLVEAYRESGVTIPIFVIPLGVDLENLINQPLKEKRHTPMVFSNLSPCLNRNNQILLIKAFAKALGNNKNAVLKINCPGGDDEIKNDIINEIVKQNCSNIHFTQIHLKNDAHLKFLKNVDCYVSLSKIEDSSLLSREAMILGIPVIATDNTGQSIICNSGLVKVVKSDILEPAYFFNSRINSGHRYNCSADDAADAIMDVYCNYDQYLKNAPEARKWAYKYSFSDESVRKVYKNLVNPIKIVFGPENKVTSEYVMTNSKELFEKYQRHIEFWQTEGTQMARKNAKH